MDHPFYWHKCLLGQNIETSLNDCLFSIMCKHCDVSLPPLSSNCTIQWAINPGMCQGLELQPLPYSSLIGHHLPFQDMSRVLLLSLMIITITQMSEEFLGCNKSWPNGIATLWWVFYDSYHHYVFIILCFQIHGSWFLSSSINSFLFLSFSSWWILQRACLDCSRIH